MSVMPRVRITCDVETGGATKAVELPFVIGVLANLSGDSTASVAYKERGFVEADRGNIAEVLRSAGASLNLSLGESHAPVCLTFASLDDFDPQRIVQRVPQHAVHLDAITQAPSFKALESTWRGLSDFVERIPTSAMLKVRVFNTRLDELEHDMNSAVDFDQSHLFKLVYETGYGTYGGVPFSLLLADFAVDDGAFISTLTMIAASAHAPIVMKTFAGSRGKVGVSDSSSEDSRYAVILRAKPTPSVYAFAEPIVQAFALNGWPVVDVSPDSALSALLAASRFAHYIEVITRGKIGTFMTRGNVEAYLNNWISQYVLLDDNAPEAVQAAYPLRAANIVVIDVPGSPGSYKATLFVQPHYKLAALTSSLRLAVELPAQ